jgi:signal transduction histidine kinase
MPTRESPLDRQRRFTADASHELRTPLSIIKANTSLALEAGHPWPEDRYREFLAAIDAAAAGRAGSWRSCSSSRGQTPGGWSVTWDRCV